MLPAPATLPELVAHVIDVHHTYARSAMLHIAPLASKVLALHGETHPELVRVNALFDLLCGELDPHMRAEEGALFPALLQMSQVDCAPARRDALRVSIAVMKHDHGGLDRVLRELRAVTAGFVAPTRCASFEMLYMELEAFAADLGEHLRLESAMLEQVEGAATSPRRAAV